MPVAVTGGSGQLGTLVLRRLADERSIKEILVMQMGTVPQELILESLRTFAEEVMPHFG
jgi:hypothetical protein